MYEHTYVHTYIHAYIYIYEHIPIYDNYVNKCLINSMISVRPDTANKMLHDSGLLCNDASKLHQNGSIHLTLV